MTDGKNHAPPKRRGMFAFSVNYPGRAPAMRASYISCVSSHW